MTAEKPVFTIQGMKFRLKPSTRNNVKAMHARFQNPEDALLELDEFDQYVELLRLITDPVEDADYDKIDVDDLDVKVVEMILANFIPRWHPIFVLLAGYSLS